MIGNNKFYCRICGLEDDELHWGNDGNCPDYTFCVCCGVEFGHQDYALESIRKFRKKWLDNGAKWDNPKFKPKNWSLENQIKQIPKEFL